MAEQPQQPRPLLLTAAQVARLLTISRRTFYRLVADGKFPPGLEIAEKVVRWQRSDIREYLRRCPRADPGKK
jgi:predicted DNA-binding transcriptional regulator AlpA